jgi:molybdopterin-guanine dinucleotide biosynthesis protein A
MNRESGKLKTDAGQGISGFVLAGGLSSRLGRDKALLPWPPHGSAAGNGNTLLTHAVTRLQRVCSTVSICASRDDLSPTEIVIPDALPGSGPLGGIVAALEHSSTDWNLLLAVDLPFLPLQVLEALVAYTFRQEDSAGTSAPSRSRTVACVLPELDGRPQPLCGLYHRILAPGLRTALLAGKFKVMAAVHEALNSPGAQRNPSDAAVIAVELWDAASFAASMHPTPDPEKWFLNINTLQDWEQAQQLQRE